MTNKIENSDSNLTTNPEKIENLLVFTKILSWQ